MRMMNQGSHPAESAAATHAPVSVNDRKTNLITDSAELVICDPAHAAVLCDAYVFEPDAAERALGTLAIVAETLNIPDADEEDNAPTPTWRRSSLQPSSDRHSSPTHSGHRSARSLLDELSTAIRTTYYRDLAHDALENFEASLQAANHVLAAAAERGETDWLTNLHAAVAVLHGSTAHVSRIGMASLLLVRGTQVTDIGEDLADTRLRNPRAPFANVASGTVKEHDVLLLASPNLFHNVPKERCASLLAGKSAREAVRYTHDLLIEVKDTSPLAAVFLRVIKAPITLPPISPVEQRSAVFAPPLATIRAPALEPPQIRRGLGRRIPLHQQSRWRVVLSTLGRILVLGSRKTLSLIAGMGKRAVHIFRTVWNRRNSVSGATLTSGVIHQPSPESSLSAGARLNRAYTAGSWILGTSIKNLREAPKLVGRSVRTWPLSTKVFIALTILLAILFTGSMVRLRRKAVEDAAVRAASELLQEARVKKDAAESTLILERTDEARQLLGEARVKLAEVEKTPYYRTEIQQLAATLQTIEDRTEHMVRIEAPQRVGDFGSVASGRRLQGLTVVGANLFVLDPQANTLHRLAHETGEVTTVAHAPEGVKAFRDVASLSEERMLLLSTEGGELVLFDTARGDLIKQSLTPVPEGTQGIRSLATFGSRLYLLFPELSQIYGYSKTLSGYQGGTPWMKDAAVPVNQARALGVDGYIYLLFADGRITKLLKGAPVEFAQSRLSTPLTNATQMVIRDRLKHLYVLDPAHQRVVVFDTTGTLSRQLVFPNARELRAMAVTDNEDTLFTLDGTSVFSVPLKETPPGPTG